jgi:pyruvate formate lyase activating enzyme
MSGIIFDIKEMAVHDGPGIRTTVFFKGLSATLQVVPQPRGIIL